MKRRDKKIYIILLFLLLLFNEHLFYLVDLNKINLAGSFNINDFILIISIIFTIIIYKSTIVLDNKLSKKYKILLYCGIPIIIFSTINAYINYNQPFILSIRPQRFLLLYLMYFSFVRYFLFYEKSIKKIEKMIIYIGAFICIMYVIQYLLIDKVQFLQVGVGVRFGEARLRFDSFIIFIEYYFILNKFIDKIKLKYIFILVINIIFITFVIKARLVLIAILISSSFILVLKKRKRYIHIYFIIWTILIIMILPNNFVKQYVNSIKLDLSSNTGTYEIRDKGREFYKEKLKDDFLFGEGIINETWPQAVYESGVNKEYFVVDNGLYGIAFLYGLTGVTWVIVLYFFILKGAYKIYREMDNISYLGISLYLIITILNIPYPIMSTYPLYLSLILAMINSNLILNNNLRMEEKS
ncbi:hypothetical protein [Clostridium perfringens]|uniref:hypothetical protein n=1 Tax=Clostridium perfringens TaxID=1502 RepID=UPI001A33E023|nr:hypothetical protein [Clostridium perfringens]MDH5068014.1 hypothetical protein [Clostridium perfringens]HAT4119821.1 hypothetical protein [Clostridium perfringens]HAT4120715.1 hypothetical protein [Clostridium perfringens]